MIEDYSGDPVGFFGQENFVHRRLIGGAIGLLTGGPGGAVRGILQGGAPRAAPPAVTRVPAVIPTTPTAPIALAAPSAGCPPGTFRDVDGQCRALGSPAEVQIGGPMRPPLSRPFGAAVMGQFGAGLAPGIRQTSTRVCPPGAVLGKDGLCYNSKGFRNSDRAHPRGPRPLLTGGERNAIRRASAAARKIARTTKQLQKLGMLPKPSRTPSKKKAAPAGQAVFVKVED